MPLIIKSLAKPLKIKSLAAKIMLDISANLWYNGYIELKRTQNIMKLLSTGNPKILKGLKQGYNTYILHLAPADL